jgi:hypothetical protein
MLHKFVEKQELSEAFDVPNQDRTQAFKSCVAIAIVVAGLLICISWYVFLAWLVLHSIFGLL